MTTREDVERVAADLFDRFPRLIQIQLEPDGQTRVWFATGLAPPYVSDPADDASFIGADPALMYTDASDLEDLRKKLAPPAKAGIRQLVTMVLGAVAKLDAELPDDVSYLPKVWHRTTSKHPDADPSTS